MKRTLLFMVCVLASITMYAEMDSIEYVPFVKKGKRWNMVRIDADSCYHFYKYVLNEEVVKDGKTYVKCKTGSVNAGLLREEDRKVYFIAPDMQKEYLLFDYSLKAGDTYETYSYEYQEMVKYEVLSVGNYTEGPEVTNYIQEADSMASQHRYLRKWVVTSEIEKELCLEPKTWIEGVGSVEGPFANLYDASPVSTWSHLTYMDDDDYNFLPFSFHDATGKIHGSNMPTGKEDYLDDDRYHKLTYEMEGNRLHVYGKAYTQCGPNNYAYFMEEPTEDSLVCKLHFVIQEVEPLADCIALHATNFYVPGFDPNKNYIVVDNQGREHPVINKTPQMAYRPFVEDGKVWKVGALNSGNPVQWVENFYFDGDTIISGKTCKQMMCQQYVNPDFADSIFISQDHSLSYVGAWYEEDKKVYIYDSINNQFKLMYDFSINAYDSLQIDNQPYVIGLRQTGGIKGFKGVYRDVWMYTDRGTIYSVPWLEGVGGTDGPTINVYPDYVDPAWFLMSCTVGDEVLYLIDDYEDGATPDIWGARKRFDFTHTIKIQPKAPMRRAAEQSVYGEYNEQQLGIHLNPLDDAYLVCITDDMGKAVYEKAINADNIMGLNIDISAYAEGCYTVTVENSHESFTGEFDTKTAGISDTLRPNNNEETRNKNIYNLQGQRISSLPANGIYIREGKKVYAR